MLEVGVLASGEGTNLSALLDACEKGRIPARVSLVVCNVPGAGALEKARRAGVPTALVEHGRYPDRRSFDAAITAELEARGVGLVVLAGFMRILGEDFIRHWQDRIVNVHPSLLPAFPGMAAARQALDAGVRVAGCTVHLVDAGTDTGPIIAQAAVPVVPGDTEQSLHARIREQEHRLLPEVVGLFAKGLVSVEGRRVAIDLPPDSWPTGVLACPHPDRP
ncbi:phosphoribosylglycinamide formyltransferase [Vulgatibacter incomptus]|uniref:Phosphoribosylglycinamide formyltransferase n=1 Tax=Vulgatibacter incomptus TaxID=1391653 RepID=A0A0K1P8L7_9BACT|nr:phosphoribosylglycinamide formyltransferase [Vulgatibacter incomptus]AKU89865.1 Phosphoribosylglycinamide formyltransferase [Vulgatibacter incomptus]